MARRRTLGYVQLEWTTVLTYTLDGQYHTPLYEQPNLTNDQRLGNQTQHYPVPFESDEGYKSYTPDDLKEYQQFRVGEVWVLRFCALRNVVSVEP